ncbi:hypothetical protein ABFU66_17175 [Xanthomonas campestris pv. raphani]|uniref:hypothetical protein n=1 Tax=Xanthomonas campestris TaxID=339 RepID=UPI002B239A74|nr:hypothetical protein [Xanthomonas campestris]MEA9971677.1 hypothetical protein [Xanthomonas campestris pv. raphani]
MLFDYRLLVISSTPDGFDLPICIVQAMPPAPPVFTTLILREDVRSGIDRYFSDNPGLANHKHHAAIDADAFRWAFIDALAGRDNESWAH